MNFGEALNHELAGSGVSVSTLNPGMTATEFLEVSGQEITLMQRLTLMSAQSVSNIGLNGMFKRKSIIVPGLLNKIIILTTKLAPRWFQTRAAHLLMK